MLSEKNPRFMHNSIETTTNTYLNLVHVGWEKCHPGYSYINRRNIYLLHYIKNGKGYLQFDNTRYFLSSGDAFLIRPNHFATYTADKEEPWEYYYFAFNGELSEKILSKTHFSNNTVCATLENDSILNYIKDAVYNLNNQHNIDFLSLEYIFKFFSCLYTSSKKGNKKIISKKNHYISTLEEYITFNYSKPLSVSELSNIFNLNRSHLHRLFKSQTGKSVEEFIIYVRIQEAKRFLRETNYSVTDIAHFVGYTSYPSFYKKFKCLVGTTPTEYRVAHSEIIHTEI